MFNYNNFCKIIVIFICYLQAAKCALNSLYIHLYMMGFCFWLHFRRYITIWSRYFFLFYIIQITHIKYSFVVCLFVLYNLNWFLNNLTDNINNNNNNIIWLLLFKIQFICFPIVVLCVSYCKTTTTIYSLFAFQFIFG